MRLLFLFSVMALPMTVFGHGNAIELTNLSVNSALEKFQSEEPDETKDAFGGVKAWPSADLIKVKVYINDADAMTYSCKMEHADGGEEVVCIED